MVRPTDAFRLPGYDFVDPGLLAQALTHRSAAPLHNERLEFLGDALVNLIVAEALYQLWPKADEGTLTRARAELVRESSLATIARHMDLGTHLILGPGEMKSGGHRRDSIRLLHAPASYIAQRARAIGKQRGHCCGHCSVWNCVQVCIERA